MSAQNAVEVFAGHAEAFCSGLLRDGAGFFICFGNVPCHSKSDLSDFFRIMQANNQTFSDFLRRTDLLAEKLQLRLIDLPEKIGISKAMLFAYRKGTNPISGKAWIRLEQAERAAGLSPPVNERLYTAPTPEEKSRILESASYNEIFQMLPPEARNLLAQGRLDSINGKILDYFNNAEFLAVAVEMLLDKPDDKETMEMVLEAKKRVRRDYKTTRELWDMIYKRLCIRWEEDS